MKTYKITITGWQLIASGHSLKDEEVANIREYQEENNINSLAEISNDLAELVDGYYCGDGNMWSFTGPLENDGLNFHLTDLDDTEILMFSLKDVGDHQDYEADFDMLITFLHDNIKFTDLKKLG